MASDPNHLSAVSAATADRPKHVEYAMTRGGRDAEKAGADSRVHISHEVFDTCREACAHQAARVRRPDGEVLAKAQTLDGGVDALHLGEEVIHGGGVCRRGGRARYIIVEDVLVSNCNLQARDDVSEYSTRSRPVNPTYTRDVVRTIRLDRICQSSDLGGESAGIRVDIFRNVWSAAWLRVRSPEKARRGTNVDQVPRYRSFKVNVYLVYSQIAAQMVMLTLVSLMAWRTWAVTLQFAE